MAKKIRGPVVFTPEEIPKPLSLQVVTWNVGNAEPDNDLTNLLGPKGEGRARMCDRWGGRRRGQLVGDAAIRHHPRIDHMRISATLVKLDPHWLIPMQP